MRQKPQTARGIFDDDRPQNKRSTGTYCGLIKYLSSGRQPMEELVRHLTSVPAQILHLQDRGIIAQGKVADVVVFDPTSLRANENYIEPSQRPEGISYVLVGAKSPCPHPHRRGHYDEHLIAKE